MITDTAARTRIYGWAFRLLRNHHDALDATQEVMLRVLRQPGREIKNPGAWLRRVTVNHCLDMIRARRPEGGSVAEPIERRSPQGEAALAELHAAVLSGLETLSEQQRAVLIAKVYDQETFAVIAAGMELAIPTVKTHYVRALRAMRRSLQPHAEATS